MVVFLPAGLVLIVSIIFWIFPPKKINYWYGYRTKRSMSHQEIWNYSNQLAARALFWLSIGNLFLDVVLFLSLPTGAATLIGVGILLASLVVLVLFIERHLANRFDV